MPSDLVEKLISKEEIGKFSTVQRLVNLNADRKRLWLDTLQSINDKKMNMSVPICMDFLTKEQIQNLF